MMATAGVRIDWIKAGESKKPGTIIIPFAKAANQEKTMAEAKVFEGTNIKLFIDRILPHATKDDAWRVLSHVMAHEITHILQATDTHARTGIMKAQWGSSDFGSMLFKPLSFESGDIELIQRGMEKRQAANNTVLASAK